MTIEKAIRHFIDHCRVEKNLSPKTLEAYSIDLKQFQSFTRKNTLQEISTIDRSLIRAYCVQLSCYQPRTVKRKIACLKAMFNFLEFDDLIEFNPFRKMRLTLKTPKSLPVVMSLSEISSVIRCAYEQREKVTDHQTYAYKEATRDVCILEFLFATGVRVSELCNLRANAINLRSGAVRIVGKGNKERLITVVEKETLQLLKEYHVLFRKQIQKSGYFFLNRLGNVISDQSVRYMIQKYTALAKINKHVTPHTFRHTFATLLLESDVDIKYIQHFLGHSSIMTTQIYTHVNQEKQQQILSAKHPRLRFKISDVVI